MAGGFIKTMTVAAALFAPAMAFAAADITPIPKPIDVPKVLLPAPDLSGADWHWVHNTEIDCWAYTPYNASRFTWTGACKEQVIAGKGTLTWFIGDKQTAVHTGLFESGKLNGAGRIDYLDGGLLEGNFENGVLEGAGRQRWSCGDDYQGTFHNGLPDGKGKYVFCRGESYAGEMHAGRFEGAGLWTMRNGGVLDGTFKNGKPVGVVSYRGPDGTTLKGELIIPHNDPAFPILPTTYPEGSLRRQEEGRVWVSFTVKTDGHVTDVALEKTSGYDDFDQAALAAGPSWRMTPATVGGTPIDFPARRAVTFKLEG